MLGIGQSFSDVVEPVRLLTQEITENSKAQHKDNIYQCPVSS